MQHYSLVILEWCKFNVSISNVHIVLLLSCACCLSQISSSVDGSRELLSSTRVAKPWSPCLGRQAFHIFTTSAMMVEVMRSRTSSYGIVRSSILSRRIARF